MNTTQLRLLGRVTALCAAGLLAACSGGGPGNPADSLQIQEISVQPNQEWQINRPIEVLFSAPVDFSTVNLNTIQISDTNGRTAIGTFSQGRDPSGDLDPRRVRFQPACPTRGDNSDAGLLPGGVDYTLSVAGENGDALTVRSTTGSRVMQGRAVMFRTPNSVNTQQIFQDPVPGPAAVRLRGRNGIAADEMAATYLELGGDPDSRVYFAVGNGVVGELPEDAMGNPFPVPLNHYSIVENQVAVILHLDQPVQVSDANISDTRVRFEYEDPRILDQNQRWVRIPTRVELEANCTDTGAVLRLTPIGVLPQGANMRVNLKSAFQDLAGNAASGDQFDFAIMRASLVNNPGVADPSRDVDEILETFLVGGAVDESLEDVEAPLALPRADWEEGRLTAGFDFDGTGGVNGAFDWIVPEGVQVTIDTTLDRITGGDGSITGEQPVINGVIDVRDVRIPASSQVRFQGPNPVTILASRNVYLDGRLIVSGDDSLGVVTLNTTSVAEPGAIGRAGGGSGGVGSFLSSQSTPRGGPGFGAYNLPGAGGGGGESSYHPNAKNARRGAGGGGGRFGPDIYYPLLDNGSPPTERFVQCQILVGMDAEPGFPGGTPEAGLGAVSQTARAEGGVMGPFPFFDDRDDNNFLGSLLVDPGEPTETLIRGELDRPWAGAGGGAGGDAVASASFPRIPFLVTGDEKGSGGGAGGGSIRILAIGDILIGDGGGIEADGGRGGGGENTNFFDRVGGGAGGGSGGHIILSSANQISITTAGVNTGTFYNDPETPNINDRNPNRPISAIGGNGGPGREDVPANPRWRCDAVPYDRVLVTFPGGGTVRVPPIDENCFGNTMGSNNAGPPGAGGDGGPGLIQLHVDSPAQNLLFPGQNQGGQVYGVDLDVTPAMTPPPVGWHDVDDVDVMLPFFGSASVAQSRWIRLGQGRLTPDPGNPGNFLADEQVTLSFAGTDAFGSLDRTGTDVNLLAPIVGPDVLASAPATPYIEAGSGGATLVLDASGLVGADDVYKRNAELVRLMLLRLVDSADANNERRYSVSDASYDAGTDQLRITVSTEDGAPDAFVAAGNVQVSLVPAFFRVNTMGTEDELPVQADIRVTFDATLQDAAGNPNPDLAYSAQDDGMGMGGVNGFTPNISNLNAQNWDFVRFRVLFDLNTMPGGGVNLDTPRPSLEHLRIQLSY